MKPKFLTYGALALFTYTFLNNGVFANCVNVTVYNRGSWWSPYITYTPCMQNEERTDDLGWWSDYETFSTQSGKPIKLGPKGTWTVYFEQTPYDNYFSVVCSGVLGSSATCEVPRNLQKFLEQHKKTGQQKGPTPQNVKKDQLTKPKKNP